MDCQEVQEYLIGENESDLEEARLAEIQTHLETCSICRREASTPWRLDDFWRGLAATSSASAPWPPEGRPHLSVDQLFALAQGPEGPLDHYTRAKWRHMLECPECYDACSWLRRRQLHQATTEGTEFDVSLDELMDAWRRMSLTVACFWAGLALSVRAAVPVSKLEMRGAADAFVIEHRFDKYKVTLTLMPDGPEEKTCRLDVKLQGEREADTANVSAELYRDGRGPVKSRSFHDGRAEFPNLSPAAYYLELNDLGSVIGGIELPISESAPNQ